MRTCSILEVENSVWQLPPDSQPRIETPSLSGRRQRCGPQIGRCKGNAHLEAEILLGKFRTAAERSCQIKGENLQTNN